MKTRIVNYLKAGYAGLYIVSHEELRVEAAMKEAIETLNKSQGDEPFSLHAWSCTDGLVEATDASATPKDITEPMDMLAEFYKAPQKTIYLVRDFHVFVEDKNPLIWRKLKDALVSGRANNKAIVIVGCRYVLPPELEKEITVLDFSLPTKDQLKVVLHALLGHNGHSAKSIEDEAGILAAASGLTTSEAENAFALSVVECGKVTRDIVFREKCQAVRKNGLLEVVDSSVTLADIGGLENLKAWLLERRNAFTEEARAYGLPRPVGFLSVGNPGTGKTLTAKAVRSVLGVPLLRLEAGKLFGSLVGQSESNWRAAHATFKAMAPCIVHIDEVDGAVSGTGSSGQTDGGTTDRVVKAMLQDIAENSEGIFYVLTANDVDKLPAPLLQRMDAVWNVELPNTVERAAIWAIQIAKVKRDPKKFDLTKLAEKSEGYSGREIEKLVSESLYRAFADGMREPTTEDAVLLMESFIPTSITMAADMEKRSKRLSGVARLAGGTPSAPAAKASVPAKGTRKISFAKNTEVGNN
jgi:SpoVK/Ycf46/Vps4 family AAA+-type ATPase